MNTRKLFLLCFCGLMISWHMTAQEINTSIDSLHNVIRNMPTIEVGKGISFQPRNKSYKLTMRFRMQNLVAADFDKDFSIQKTQAQVKRLRLRFDGYIYSPKLVYSIQFGFTPYDTKVLPNENGNIVRDAIVYYVPNDTWNIGFGQTKIRANRARMNSSGALQFVDRSIVNSQFNLDRDFGIFGEYHKRLFAAFHLSMKGAVTMGEGRNWGSSQNSGLMYTGRLELFPLGRFKSAGEITEGDLAREEKPKILIAGAYSYNDRALRLEGSKGNLLPTGETRDIKSYFLDLIVKYNGFAFYVDYMGRLCNTPLFDENTDICIYTGNGLNMQTSYLLPKNWEIALRNSTLFPENKIRNIAGYHSFNQTSLGITRYLIGHNLKIQADASYNHLRKALNPDYNRWEFRLQLELGL